MTKLLAENKPSLADCTPMAVLMAATRRLAFCAFMALMALMAAKPFLVHPHDKTESTVTFYCTPVYLTDRINMVCHRGRRTPGDVPVPVKAE